MTAKKKKKKLHNHLTNAHATHSFYARITLKKKKKEN